MNNSFSSLCKNARVEISLTLFTFIKSDYFFNGNLKTIKHTSYKYENKTNVFISLHDLIDKNQTQMHPAEMAVVLD